MGEFAGRHSTSGVGCCQVDERGRKLLEPCPYYTLSSISRSKNFSPSTQLLPPFFNIDIIPT